MKSQRSYSRFPLAIIGVLAFAAIGFMAYLSTIHPAPTVTQVEKEISLDGLAAPTAVPQQPTTGAATPSQLPLPAEGDHAAP